MEALSAAMQVLGFMERPEEEVPPVEIWHHEERLKEFFESVKQDREDRMNGVERVPDPELTPNEALRDFRR